MSKIFAALALLTLVLGTISFAAPASADPTYPYPPNQNEGTNN